MIYPLYCEKEVNKNVYSNIMNSIKLQNKIDTILRYSKNSRTSDPRRLLLSFTDKTDLKSSNKYVPL